MTGATLQPRNKAYAFRAEPYPAEQDVLSVEARRLAVSGLSDFEIGAALRLDPAAVRRLLAADQCEATELHANAWAARRNFAGKGA